MTQHELKNELIKNAYHGISTHFTAYKGFPLNAWRRKYEQQIIKCSMGFDSAIEDSSCKLVEHNPYDDYSIYQKVVSESKKSKVVVYYLSDESIGKITTVLYSIEKKEN